MEHRSTYKKSVQGIVFITAFFSLIFFSAQAMGRGFELGIRYEVQKSYLSNSSDKNAGAQLSPESTWSYMNGGIAIGYDVNSLIGVEVNVLRSRQGQSYTGTNPVYNTTSYSREVVLQGLLNNEAITGSYQAKAELNCIKIPILLKITSPKIMGIYFHAEVGPQINKVSSVVYELNHEDIDLPGISMKPEDAYRKTTIDGVLAAGIGYQLARHLNVSADIRYDHGFKDVEEKGATYSAGSSAAQNYYAAGRPSTYNSTLGLMIGINYKL
jgi:hypothetical protein